MAPQEYTGKLSEVAPVQTEALHEAVGIMEEVLFSPALIARAMQSEGRASRLTFGSGALHCNIGSYRMDEHSTALFGTSNREYFGWN